MNKCEEIYGYEGAYLIYDTGKVYSQLTNKFLKGDVDRYGYLHYILYKDRKKKHFTAHRLVAIHFIPCNDWSLTVNHKDGNKLNNHFTNLEWCTNLENKKHSINVLGNSFKGENNPSVKLNSEKVIEIKKMITEGHSQHRIAKVFNISRSTISMIAINRIWQSIS